MAFPGQPSDCRSHTRVLVLSRPLPSGPVKSGDKCRILKADQNTTAIKGKRAFSVVRWTTALWLLRTSSHLILPTMPGGFRYTIFQTKKQRCRKMGQTTPSYTASKFLGKDFNSCLLVPNPMLFPLHLIRTSEESWNWFNFGSYYLYCSNYSP